VSAGALGAPWRLETEVSVDLSGFERQIGGQVFEAPAVVWGGWARPDASHGAGFKSFDAFKRAQGSAGPGQAWHHVVEQMPGNVAKFGPQAIHNTTNLVKLPHGAGSIHAKVSGYYSSKRAFSAGMTVREWIGTKSFKEQRAFGLDVIKLFGGSP
jgi:hypothetical protein